MSEFQAFPKIPRLRRDVVITEKIDGTNACIVIHKIVEPEPVPDGSVALVNTGEAMFTVQAQSRNRLINPYDDNAGFARFVYDNAEPLASRLGDGYHYGEWYGQKIARNYGLKEKRFALFNTKRWGFLPCNTVTDTEWPELPQVFRVPILSSGVLSDELIDHALTHLRQHGSMAVPGFQKPEGIVVFHTASGQLYKVLLEGDELPKGLLTQREKELANE
jgi:hypothetical protein